MVTRTLQTFHSEVVYVTDINSLTSCRTRSKIVNSSFPDNSTHEAAEPARMAVPDAGTTSTLRDVPLGDSWKIGDQLPKGNEKYATVYLVLDKSDLPVEGLKAHAFALDNT